MTAIKLNFLCKSSNFMRFYIFSLNKEEIIEFLFDFLLGYCVMLFIKSLIIMINTKYIKNVINREHILYNH